MKYLGNEELLFEVLKWKETNNMSINLANMFKLLINNSIYNWFSFHTYDVEDVKQNCFIDILKYGRNFDENKSKNAFGYFTSIIRMSMLKNVISLNNHYNVTQTFEEIH